MNLKDSVRTLSGIGDKRADLLKKIGLLSMNDLIHYYPRDYEQYMGIVTIDTLTENQNAYIKGRVTRSPENLRVRSLIMTKTMIEDHTGSIHVTWFNQPYLKNQLKAGTELVLKGKLITKNGQKQLSAPRIIKEEALISSGGLLPIYPLTKQISNKLIHNLIQVTLEHSRGHLVEFLHDGILKTLNLMGYEEAVFQIHQPSNNAILSKAKQRLIFNEFFLFQLGMLLIKSDTIKVANRFQLQKQEIVGDFLESLPFELTQAQQSVFKEIQKDLQGPHIMNRLIQGDVGSGKTIVASLALLQVIENGYQGVMMVPTEVLAKQHYLTLTALFARYNINIVLLTGSLTVKEKNSVYETIASGESHMIVGTHAVIQEKVQFHNLGLVITDEQHRFGVKQREALAGKGHFPHVLVMSATPIPRTLSLILYGDMDISVIGELPKGRIPIKTYVVDQTYRERLYSFIESQVSNGKQCYVICPMVEENEELDLVDVGTYTTQLKASLPESIKVSSLHGKMKSKEKQEIMMGFATNKIQVLVSTTVVEVGVNVPNATLMIIENAERFGLAQLHQLRGRVGRGDAESHCVLISNSKNKVAKERLAVMKKWQDGFVIADYDLKLRGPGDSFGTKQHGLPEFRIGHIIDDVDLLKKAAEVAKAILEKDPALEDKMHSQLKETMSDYFNTQVQMVHL